MLRQSMGKIRIGLMCLMLGSLPACHMVSPAPSVEDIPAVESGFRQALEKKMSSEGISSYEITIENIGIEPEKKKTLRVEYSVAYLPPSAEGATGSRIMFSGVSELKPIRSFWKSSHAWNVIQTEQKSYSIEFEGSSVDAKLSGHLRN